MKTTAVILVSLVSFAASLIAGVDPARTWTNKSGNSFNGTFRHCDGVSVWLKKSAEGELKVALADLSPADQAAVKELQSDFSWKVKGAFWPAAVSAPATRPAFAVPGHREDKLRIFQTPGFEFKVDAALTVKEVGDFGRTFEASIALFKLLPWDVRPAPPEGTHYQVRIFADRSDFMKATGATDEGSAKLAGLYKRHDRVIYVPLESLREGNKSSNDTLRHELTHQMMHDMLPLMPWWLAEGTAEYVRAIPWDGFGTYQCSKMATAGVMKELAAEGPMNEFAFGMLFPADGPESPEAFKGNQLASARESALSQLLKIRAGRADRLAGKTKPVPAAAGTPAFAPGKIKGETAVSYSFPRDEGRVTVLKYHAAKMLVYYLQHLEGDGRGTKMLRMMWLLRQWADETNLLRTRFEKEADEFRTKFTAFEATAKNFAKMETAYVEAYPKWLRSYNGQPTDPPKPVAPEEELIKLLPDAPDFVAFTPTRQKMRWTEILQKSIGDSPQKYYAEIIAAFKARKIDLKILEGDPGATGPHVGLPPPPKAGGARRRLKGSSDDN